MPCVKFIGRMQIVRASVVIRRMKPKSEPAQTLDLDVDD